MVPAVTGVVMTTPVAILSAAVLRIGGTPADENLTEGCASIHASARSELRRVSYLCSPHTWLRYIVVTFVALL